MTKTSPARRHIFTIWLLDDTYFIICFSWEKAQVPEAQVELRSHTPPPPTQSSSILPSVFVIHDGWMLQYFTILPLAIII